MKQLSPEALDVLSGHVAIDGAALRITKPLDRKLYVEVNAALMNPPFSKRADVAHVLRAFNLLEPRGRLVAIASAGVKFRQDALALDLRTLIRRCGSVEPLPDGSFSESGTDVRTVLVTLEAP
jgi:hypothetical protein